MIEWLEEARALTLQFVRELDDEALCAQPDPELSPIAWHLGHVAFTEAFWLVRDEALTKPYESRWAQGGTPKGERAKQPPKDEILDYLARVRARVLERPPADDFYAWLIAAHEHQHRETMTIVRHLAAPWSIPSAPWSEGTITFDRATFTMGTDDRLAYDNERPAHVVEVAPFEIDLYPASAEMWAEFVRDTGMRMPRTDGDPVAGISYGEADAFARWRGMRLPTEAEWELAAPRLSGVGRVWEWTSTPFAPYPGFEAFPYRGYSVPYFDGKHRVLRGGSFASHRLVARRTFRNWYEPHVRAIFAGVRCARSI